MDNDNFYQSGQTQQTEVEDAINLRHYWHIILERRWLVIAAFISVFALCLIYLFKATPIYQAITRIQIDRESENMLRIERLSIASNQEQDYLQTQYKNLLSRALLRKVIEKLKLDKDAYYAKSVDLIKSVADDIQVVPIRLSRLVDVKAEHPDRNKAADIANTLVDIFIEDNLTFKTSESTERVKFLAQEEVTRGREVEAAQQALSDYIKAQKQVSFEDTENIVMQLLRQYQADYAKAKNQADEAQKIIEEISQLGQRGEPLAAIPYVQADPQFATLSKDLAGLKAKFDGLKQRLGPKHSDYIELEKSIESMENSVAAQAENVVKALKTTAGIARQNAEESQRRVTEQELAQIELGQKKIQYDNLKRRFDRAEEIFRLVLNSKMQEEITSKNTMNNMHKVFAAEVPLKSVKPRWVLTILLGIIGGLGVAVGLAFFVNYLDDSIKSQDDVETYLRLPFLGYVPNIKANSVAERDLQAHRHPQSNAAEGFRTIRATVSLTHKSEKFRVLAVTSTIPSEGKSLVASNFAIVTAQTGVKTLLVDADLRRPSVHKAFQLHSPTGLSSFLTEEASSLDAIVHHTEVANLDVVCCGSVPSTPSELIGSKRMQEFLEQASGRYDRIVLDCPPISAVSDPLIIAAMSDGVVFVTKFNKIRREHARKSVQRLQNAGIHILGVVLNDIDFEGKDSYYYSYYYYQNRYYSSHYRTRPDGTKSKPKEEMLVKSRNGGE